MNQFQFLDIQQTCSTTHINMATSGELPEGIGSLLDTDLYKLTMQCAVLKYFPDIGICTQPVRARTVC
jgi:nicotinic acid phosphoribosyltransferase